jgi:putative phosphoserine phosphatase/1-acylglycerol-3-phosphate O-acyltransferase
MISSTLSPDATGEGTEVAPASAPDVAGPAEEGGAGEAVFVDLDRTLLRGASGHVLGAALRTEGMVRGRPAIPGERLLYASYDLFGETVPFMALARGAAHLTRGWSVEAMHRAGELAAPELLELVQPYAPAVLAAHRQAGRTLVLATTTPRDLIEPFARAAGFEHVVATRYAVDEGRYTGGIDGEFVWAAGKLAAVRRWCDQHDVDLARSHAYSDSVFDLPLLHACGHPHAVNPDLRLWAVAAARRWPVEFWDRPSGVPKMAGVEAYHLLRPVVRPELIPYARFDISGVEHVPRHGPALVASNHRSYFDVVALALVAARLGRPVRFLGKKELFDAPIIGQLARALGGISVDRGGQTDEALRQAIRALEAGEVVVILPQGTIPRGRAFFDPVLRGRTGVARLAARTGAPVVPVGLWGTERVWPRSARLPDVWNVVHPPTVRVRLGAPVALDHRDAKRDTAAVMHAIVDLLPPEARLPADPDDDDVARTVPPGHDDE